MWQVKSTPDPLCACCRTTMELCAASARSVTGSSMTQLQSLMRMRRKKMRQALQPVLCLVCSPCTAPAWAAPQYNSPLPPWVADVLCSLCLAVRHAVPRAQDSSLDASHCLSWHCKMPGQVTSAALFAPCMSLSAMAGQPAYPFSRLSRSMIQPVYNSRPACPHGRAAHCH